jgi:AcrR family transcriptional regulator
MDQKILILTTPMSMSSDHTSKERTKEPPQALLDAAFSVFSRKGYRATRLEEVAEAAGMTKGAIYYHFSGKEDLLRRAVENRHRAIFSEIEKALEKEDAPASARIRLALRKVWSHWTETAWGDAFRLLVGQLSVELPALFRTWAQEGPLEGYRIVRCLIDEGIERGEFRRDVDSEAAARLVVSGLLLQAAFHLHLGLDDLAPGDPDRIFDSAVDIFLHGLSVTHQAPGSSRPPSPAP